MISETSARIVARLSEGASFTIDKREITVRRRRVIIWAREWDGGAPVASIYECCDPGARPIRVPVEHARGSRDGVVSGLDLLETLKRWVARLPEDER